MKKAKSRLKSKVAVAARNAVAAREARPAPSSSSSKKQVSHPKSGRHQSHRSEGKAIKYVRYLPMLLVALLAYGGLALLVYNFYPNQIANLVLVNSYALLVIPFLIANTLFFSYLFLNTRRGFLLSCALTIALFLRLQKVTFEWQWVLLGGGILVVTEALGTFTDKVLDRDAE